MSKEIVIETLKQYFNAEILNDIVLLEDYFEIVLSNGQKLKISTKEKA